MVESQALLKFVNEEAVLVPEGVELIRGLAGLICPVIFIGDGRAGKSYLASRVAGVPDVFASSDSAEPVTEGIDICTLPVDKVLQELGIEHEGAQEEHLLLLDCEGGNNALAAVRTLVNVFGLVIGTAVVFVACGMASEQALQNLAASLASTSLIRLDAESRLEARRLVFVVNKNSLRYDESALEKILEAHPFDPGRAELRNTIRDNFPQRQFFAVPLLGMPNFESAVTQLRSAIVCGRKPLSMAGTHVKAAQLVGLLEWLVAGNWRTNQVSFPSMHRYVILDGFLNPLGDNLCAEAEAALPRLDDYEPQLDSMDPRPQALRQFDELTSHVAHKGLLSEARAAVEQRLNRVWEALVRQNDTYGDQALEMWTETREIALGATTEPLGGNGLLRHLVITTRTVRIESRAVIKRKRGGEPEAGEWAELGGPNTRILESAFEQLRILPVLRGRLRKRSPNLLRQIITVIKQVNLQERECVLKDGHFLWWDLDRNQDDEGAKGCLNFLLHRAEVVRVLDEPHTFIIRPAEAHGWTNTSCFSGGEMREFVFDAETCEVSMDRWVGALEQHIEFGNLAHKQVGEERLLQQVGHFKPSWGQVNIDGPAPVIRDPEQRGSPTSSR